MLLKTVFSTEVTPKYELLATDTMKLPDGTCLFRIRALRAFGLVEKGQLGGYLQSQTNLSHSGFSWVSGGAIVMDHARVSENAIATGDCVIMGNVILKGNCHVLDDVVVTGRVTVTGSTRLDGSKVFTGTKVIGNSSSRATHVCTVSFDTVNGNAQSKKHRAAVGRGSICHPIGELGASPIALVHCRSSLSWQ